MTDSNRRAFMAAAALTGAAALDARAGADIGSGTCIAI